MIIKQIDINFKVEILKNNLNSSFLKKIEKLENKFSEQISIEKICEKINTRPDKIKKVENYQFNNNQIIEYKILVAKLTYARMALAIDYDKKIIYIIAIMILTKDITKAKFDKMVEKLK